MSKLSKSLLAYTFSHFCVDFACFFILFGVFKVSQNNLKDVSIGFLIYNVIAFGLQPLVGKVCDDKPRIPIGIIGCFIVLLGLFATSFPWVSMVICALGNAFFHVGGGIDSLVFSKGKMARSGIFVSSGALGVFFGTLIGNSYNALNFIPMALIVASIILLTLFAIKYENGQKCEIDVASEFSFAIVLPLIFASIMVRSYVGGIIPMEWKTGVYVFLPAFSSCLGKAIGGILGDKFGAKNIGVAALILSIPFLCFGKNIVLLSVIGIILFNITMPITLAVAASKLPYNPGLAFGLTTLALLCGNIPTFFIEVPKNLVFLLLIILIILSSICILLSTKNHFKGDEVLWKEYLDN